MQLQRRYNLPNCTLLLDGLADASGDPGYSQRLSVLMNLDCYLAGQAEPLSGGIEFLTSLLNAVSHYAQQCLSGIKHPLAQNSQSSVQLRSLGGDLHEMALYETVPPGATAPRQISLTTVQLFDLVEALDQFLADPLTLPQIGLSLLALKRDETADRIPLIERAAAPTIGTVGLALATGLFLLAPPPEIQRPLVDPLPGEEQAADPENPEASPSPDPTTSAENPTDLPPLDRQQLLELNTKLYDQINTRWSTEPRHSESLVYRVSLNRSGEIRGYREENATASQYVQDTPLNDLLVLPPEGITPETEELTDFKVVFTPDRKLEINPWNGYPPEVAATQNPETKQIKDPALIADLNGRLRDQLDESWSRSATFQDVLVFRFKLDEKGQILDFQPVSPIPKPYPAELNLPVPQVPATVNAPFMLDFRVVFKPSGVIEVSPWDGF